MAGDRIQRRVERLLDRIKQDADEENWSRVRTLAEQILGFAPDNSDARAFLTVAQERLSAAPDQQVEASQVMVWSVHPLGSLAQIVIIGALLAAACGQADGISTDTPPAPAPTSAGLLPGAQPLNISWQWQLSEEPIDLSLEVDLYNIDLFENDATVVAALHSRQRTVICYISVGSWEKWRSDADGFPPSVIGKDYGGWPGEKWLDIRQIDLLAPIMRSRLDECKAKGFDGVEPDNIDGYTNDTGFPLTYEDQLNYNIWLANEAHARGLSIGLKNDPDQVADLLDHFDWALTEDCFAEGWCHQLLPFLAAGKSVFAAEYTDTGMTLDQLCSEANAKNFNAILKHRELGVYRETCHGASVGN